MSRSPQFALAAQKEGYLKVKLFFHTWAARHVRSQVLQSELKLDPPFIEDVSVFLPPEQVSDRLSAFSDIFRGLQLAEVLAISDKLKSFEIREEDIRTLAYYEVSEG